MKWRSYFPNGETGIVEGLYGRAEAMIATLTPREQAVIKACFGLNGKGPMSMAAVGRMFHVSPVRIRQIKQKALRKLRHPIRARHIIGECDGEVNAALDRILAIEAERQKSEERHSREIWARAKRGRNY